MKAKVNGLDTEVTLSVHELLDIVQGKRLKVLVSGSPLQVEQHIYGRGTPVPLAVRQAILKDLGAGKPWSDIQRKHHVSKSTVGRVKLAG